MRRFHQWKYKNNKKLFINDSKLEKLIANNCKLIDTRNTEDFNKKHIKNSSQVYRFELKKHFNDLNFNDIYVLINDKKRANASFASWARYNGFKNVYLYVLKNDLKNSKLFTYSSKVS